MALTMDPNRITPTAGRMVVKVVEVLGGYLKGGLFMPGVGQDHGGKDTVLVEVLRKGAPPVERYAIAEDGKTWFARPCEPWVREATDQISVGDVVRMPRDVPLVFVWEEQRYAIVNEHEAILAMSMEDFLSGGFEVVPWKEGSMEGQVTYLGGPGGPEGSR